MEVTKGIRRTNYFSVRLFICVFVFGWFGGGWGVSRLVYCLDYLHVYVNFCFVDLTSVLQVTGKLFISNYVCGDHMHVRLSQSQLNHLCVRRF